jgi:hypothetical protein
MNKIAMNKIAQIDWRLGALQILRSELVTIASARDGNDRPRCPIIEGLFESCL